MDTPGRIAVGADGSSTADRAVEVAVRLALALDVPLVVVTARRPDTDDTTSGDGGAGRAAWQGEAEWAEQVVADAADLARRAGVPDVRTHTPSGGAEEALQQLATRQPGTLLVVGAVGLDSTDRRLGHVSHHLAHHVAGDLLLVRGGADANHDWSEVVLTTDGSDTSVQAALTGLALARTLDTTPLLVHVGRDAAAVEATLRAVADRIDDGGPLGLEPVVGEDVSGAIADAATGRGLLVVGNHRMHGLGRLLGSVPDDLVHALPTDLLLVNTPT